MQQERKVYTGKQCTVSVIEDSITQLTRTRLTTLQLRYPRFIHAEAKTHRVISNSGEELTQDGGFMGDPAHVLIEQQRNFPAFFAHVGKNQPGMQAHEEVAPHVKEQFTREWKELANIVADYQERWANEYGIHKQVVNRAGEPFSFISVVVSATQWDNFFALRDHEDAQPEIRDLAITMRKAMAESTLRIVHPGKLDDPRVWHLPYIQMHERQDSKNTIEDLLAMSAARCARVSYLTHDKQAPKKEDDVALYRRLVESKPLHASPLEHQAYAAASDKPSANFTGGWVQHRRVLENAGTITNLKTALHL
jgi:thymidylate synthase ThyX